jgi:hypothetical protein
MTGDTISIGGAVRPIKFGWAAIYNYEKQTGRAALADFADISTGNIKISVVIDLAVAGFSAADPKFSHTPIEVAEWFGNEPDSITEIMEMFAKSFPEATKKKETTSDKRPRETRTGTR